MAKPISASLASWVTKSRAAAALLRASDEQLQALLTLPPDLRTVPLTDVFREIDARDKVAQQAADHDLALRRQRAKAWGIPVNFPRAPRS